MCKYCEVKENEGWFDCGERFEYDNVIYKTDSGKYLIDAGVSGLDNYIELNYCPKCGRKLTEEKQI